MEPNGLSRKHDLGWRWIVAGVRVPRRRVFWRWRIVEWNRIPREYSVGRRRILERQRVSRR
jgi:hypothetical protein